MVIHRIAWFRSRRIGPPLGIPREVGGQWWNADHPKESFGSIFTISLNDGACEHVSSRITCSMLRKCARSDLT